MKSARYVNSENAQCGRARGGDAKKTSSETRADRKHGRALTFDQHSTTQVVGSKYCRLSVGPRLETSRLGVIAM